MGESVDLETFGHDPDGSYYFVLHENQPDSKCLYMTWGTTGVGFVVNTAHLKNVWTSLWWRLVLRFAVKTAHLEMFGHDPDGCYYCVLQLKPGHLEMFWRDPGSNW